MRAKDHQPLPHPSMTFSGRHTKDELADMVIALRAENAKLRDLLDGALDSQECNGYIGVQLCAEIRAALAEKE